MRNVIEEIQTLKAELADISENVQFLEQWLKEMKTAQDKAHYQRLCKLSLDIVYRQIQLFGSIAESHAQANAPIVASERKETSNEN